MTCPSNPPARQDSTNTPAFFLFLVFTSISFCNIVSAWSCLPRPTVSLFCCSGKGLAWRFHALFSVPPFASEDGEVHSQNVVVTVHVSPLLLVGSDFLVPIFLEPRFVFKLPFMLTLLCNYSFPSSIAFACFFLYFREPLLSAGHGVLPSVQDDMSGWRDTSCVRPFNTYRLY